MNHLLNKAAYTAFAISLLSIQSVATARTPDWTVYELPPCALADVRVQGRAGVSLDVRGTKAARNEQGGERAGCGVPDLAQGVLVDVLIDASRERRLERNGHAPLRIAQGFSAQRAALEVCRDRGCRHDLTLKGLADGDRVRVFVRGYLMRGQRHATTDLLTALLDRDRQRVRDCQTLVRPGGELVRIGPDCGLDYSGLPTGTTPGDSPDDGADDGVDDDPTGCPYDYYDENEWFASDTRFRFPVEPAIWAFPTAVHMDHDRSTGANTLACEPWFLGLPCYDNHKGSDFMLIGGFWKQDDESVYAVAAADGVVMATRENRFDRCVADVEPYDCSTQVCTTFFDQTVCSPCQQNEDFGEPFCQEGDEPRDYDRRPANYVHLCHADGTITRYLHLMKDSVVVDENDEVQCGDQLGLIGSSGRSSAPHLHFDVTREGLDDWIDPFDAGGGESLWVSPALPGLSPGTECQ